MQMSVPTMALLSLCYLGVACNPGGGSHGSPPPAPIASTDGASSRGGLCDSGGAEDLDAISAPFVPRVAGGFCLDPQGEPKTYGDHGKFSMDEVCTTAFDGECDVYKRFGLDRLVLLRYIDGTGAPNSVELDLSRFATVDGAYAMFTKRVVADGDPARATVKPIATGGAAALGSSNAYVWRGVYLAELTFVSEDPKMTPGWMAAANARSTGAIAHEIGGKLPGSASLPPSAAALPTASLIPLGISYYPKDALGMTAIGPVAVGYYREGDKRWRAFAIARSDVDGAKEAMRGFKLKAVGSALKSVEDDAVVTMIQESGDGPRVPFVVARKGTLVGGIGDEEFAVKSAGAGESGGPTKIAKDEKILKVEAWMK